MAANPSVAIPTDRATGTAPVARFFVPGAGGHLGGSGRTPVLVTRGSEFFTPPPLPSVGADFGFFAYGGQNPWK